jgi:uncharacterized membrane protein
MIPRRRLSPVEGYRALLFLHVVSVIVGLGVAFSYPFLLAFAERNGVGATRFALRAMARLDRLVVGPGAILALIFGFGLIFNDNNSFGGDAGDMPGWLMGAIAWYVVLLVVGVAVLRRDIADAIRVLEGVHDEGAFPAEYLGLARRLQIVAGLLGVSVLGIAYLMVWGREGGF